MPDEPAQHNRLDAALNRLEDVVKVRIEKPMKQLRQVIQWRREQGGFNEDLVSVEIEEIAFQDLSDTRRLDFITVGERVEALAGRLMKEAP